MTMQTMMSKTMTCYEENDDEFCDCNYLQSVTIQDYAALTKHIEQPMSPTRIEAGAMHTPCLHAFVICSHLKFNQSVAALRLALAMLC